MFNLFRRKRQFDDAAKETFIEAISGMLNVQMAAAGSHPIEDESGQINRKAIGYIHGFVDSALTTLGQDIGDAAIGVPIMYQIMRHLFPGSEERYTEFLVEHMGKDETVTLGAMKGGQQYIDFIVKRRPDGGIPMGLARYLIEGHEQERKSSE
jgi:hypothetical protein